MIKRDGYHQFGRLPYLNEKGETYYLDLLVWRANARLQGMNLMEAFFRFLWLWINHPLEDWNLITPLFEDDGDEGEEGSGDEGEEGTGDEGEERTGDKGEEGTWDEGEEGTWDKGKEGTWDKGKEDDGNSDMDHDAEWFVHPGDVEMDESVKEDLVNEDETEQSLYLEPDRAPGLVESEDELEDVYRQGCH